jgi:hypothetical protein
MIYDHMEQHDPERIFLIIGLIIVLLVLIVICFLTDNGWILFADYFLMAVAFFGLVGKVRG